jgi:hypothetical protein
MVTSSWTIVKPKLAAARISGRPAGHGESAGRDSDIGHGAIFAEVAAGCYTQG